MNVNVMSDIEAGKKFDLFIGNAQIKPVVVTKNKKPVWIMLSMEAAEQILIPEIFWEKESGYDNWFHSKVQDSLDWLENWSIWLVENDELMQKTEKLLV